MNDKWESRDTKLKRWMKIPAKKKLEWLYQMHQLAKSLPASKRRLRFLLRNTPPI